MQLDELGESGVLLGQLLQLLGGTGGMGGMQGMGCASGPEPAGGR